MRGGIKNNKVQQLLNANIRPFAQNYLAAYAKLINHKFQCPDHIARLINMLQKVEKGEIKRLMIFMPPRHGKSMTASIYFPAWYHGRNPDKFIMEITYSQEFANGFGAAVRNQLEDELFQDIFPRCRLSQDTKAKNHYITSAGGAYYATGLGGPITGRGANILIVDDPIKNRKEAESKAHKENIKEFYRAVAYTRLEPNAAIIIIQTRWHEDDLSGWLLKESSKENWTVINFPAISDSNKPLWPERYPLERLHEIKKIVGEYEWASLYQQQPSMKSGNIIKREWWDYYDIAPKEFDKKIQSWDMTFKKGIENDYVVGQVWGAIGAKRYLLDQIRAKMSFTEARNAFIYLTKKHPTATAKLIEDTANGPAIIDSLKNEVTGIIPVKPQGDKVVRAYAITPIIEAGNVFLPKPEYQNWVYGFIDRCAMFPSVDHDDEIDAMSQALSYLERDRSGSIRLQKLLQGV